jgi:hypothetical protein
MKFFDIICGSSSLGDSPILDRIFYHHKYNLEAKYQSIFLLINKRLREEYMQYINIGKSKMLRINLSANTLFGLQNFAQTLKYLWLNSFPNSKTDRTDILEMSKLKNLSSLWLDNVEYSNNIIRELDCIKIEKLRIESDRIHNTSLYHIFDNFLDLKILRISKIYDDNTLKNIKNLSKLEKLVLDLDGRGDNLKYLRELDNLKILEVYLSRNFDANSFEYLEKFDHLKKMTINDINTEYFFSKNYINNIIKNDHLESIVLCDTYIDSTYIKLLIAKNLKKLHLNWCCLIDTSDCFIVLKQNIENVKNFEFDVYAEGDNTEIINIDIINYLKSNIKYFEFFGFF